MNIIEQSFIITLSKEQRPAVAPFLWWLMGDQIKSMSVDSPSYEQFRDGNSWMHLTGLTGEEHSWFNIGYVDASTHQPEILAKYANILKANGLPGVLLLNGTIHDGIAEVIQDLKPKSIDREPQMVSVPQSLFELPLSEQVVRITEQGALFDDAIRCQADAFGFDYEQIRSTMGPKMLSNPAVHLYAVVGDGNNVLSTGTFVRSDQNVAGLWNMATSPDAQGQGFGTQLLRYGMNDLMMKEVRGFQLLPSDKAAEQFYIKRGEYKTVAHGTALTF